MLSPLYIIALIGASFLSVQAVPPCPLVLSIDISDGIPLPNSDSILFDNLVFPVESQFIFENTTRACVCDIKPCIRKCCPDGESVFEEGCRPNPDVPSMKFHRHTEPVVNSTSDLYTIYNSECMESEPVLLFPDEDEFFIQENGTMYMLGINSSIVSQDKFCYEYFDFEDIQGNFSVLICPMQSPIAEESDYLYVGMIISMPFLLVTFIVYALLPDRNIHGKCLMSYVITLFSAYVILVGIQLNSTTINYDVCRFVGLICLYFFMVSFFWMNVMSIDIWWTFSGMKGRVGSKRKSEKRKFLIYCAYSWGAPLLLVIVVASLSFSKNIPMTAWYNPGMGNGQCWFKEGISTFVFFYLPMSAIIIANAIFFTITSYKIKQIQRDTSMLRKDESKKHSYENNKQMFNLYLKLSLAMGVNWIMEIISWAVNWQVENTPKAVWYLTDFFNAIYGVFIFFIFVFKRKTWKMLKLRYSNFRERKNLTGGVQMGYVSRTRRSSLNQTVTSDFTSFAEDTSIAPTSSVT